MRTAYIAARFSRRHEAHALAKELQTMGHGISCRWVKPDADHVLPTGLSQQAEDSERARFAREDIKDLLGADWIISLQEEPRSNGRGGRHIELGFAMAANYYNAQLPSGLNMKVSCIGPRETVFHHLPEVEHFDTIESFLHHEWNELPSPWTMRGV